MTSSVKNVGVQIFTQAILTSFFSSTWPYRDGAEVPIGNYGARRLHKVICKVCPLFWVMKVKAELASVVG